MPRNMHFSGADMPNVTPSIWLLRRTKQKTWTLESFYDGSPGGKILVHRQSHDGAVVYRWQYQFNVDDQQGPGNNCDVNQTVLIKGFKITVRWDWFPMIERVERSERWFTRFAPLWLIRRFRKWLSQTSESCCHGACGYQCESSTGIEYFPARNLSQVCAISRIAMCAETKPCFSRFIPWT